jgi:UDP-N-acetylmuramoylalanine-D-glutamate ligase
MQSEASDPSAEDYAAALAYLFSPPRKFPPLLSPTSPELDIMFDARKAALWKFIQRHAASTEATPQETFSIHAHCLIFHVAGTKGKGSTSALLESVLRNAKYKTVRLNIF